MTERQLLRVFIFFAQGLGRVQLTRYKARLKPKAKIGNTMTERQLLRVFIFFAQGLGRVQLNKIQRRFTPTVSKLSLDR